MTKPGRTNFGFASISRALFALLALALSGQAAATSGCEIQYNGSSSLSGDKNTVVNVSFNIVDTSGGTACPPSVVGTTTLGGDTTGGASAPPNWSGTEGGPPVDVPVTLGPDSGGSVTVTVDCASCVAGADVLTYTITTNSEWDLVTTTGPTFTVGKGETVDLGVKYLVDGDSANLNTSWEVDSVNGVLTYNTIPADSSTGEAVNTFYSYQPGTYVVTVSGECPPIIIIIDGLAAPTPSCPPGDETFTITVVPPELEPVEPAGGTASIAQKSSIVLKVESTNVGDPVSDRNIDWNISSEPSGGAGNFTGGSGTPSQVTTVTDSNGETQVTLNVTEAGTYTVFAGDCPDGCEASTTFTITVVPTSADLSIVKTAAGTAAPGGQLTYSITISNAGPDPASQVVFTDTLPSELTFASISTPSGWQCTTPAVGSGGTVSCDKNVMLANGSNVLTLVTNVKPNTAVGSSISNTASVSTPFDPNTADNDSTVATSVSASAPSLSVLKELTGTADNDTSGSVSAGDRLDYRVTAKNNGNTGLTNVVVSDDHFTATQTCATLAVDAECVLTGSYVVTAADVTVGSVTNVGTATSTEVAGPISSSVITPIVSTEPVTLGVGTGDGQSAPVNTPFPQALTVVAGGVPPSAPSGAAAKSGLAAVAAPNITINWQVMSGSATLADDTSQTNSDGIASMNAFAGPNPGPVVIRASRDDDDSVFVEFHLTVTASDNSFSDLPGLDENQKALAEVLDQICSTPSGGGSTPELAATTSTSNLSDLQDRCAELLAAIETDPEGVIGALDQLFADIALVQSETSLLAAQSQFDNIKARIAALRSGTNRTSFGGLAFRNASGRLPIGGMFQSLLDQDPAPSGGGAPQEVGADFSRWGFFASGTIGRGDADAGSLSPEYDYDIDGLTFGADYRVSDKLIFGGTLGYTKQTNELADERGDLDTKGWSVSAYGTWYQQSSWYVDGVLSWGQNSYDIERHVRYIVETPSGTVTVDNSGHGEGDGDSLTFALSVGRDFNKGGWGFGPYLRAMYTKMDFDTIQEEFDEALPGSGLALELDTRSVKSLTSTLGGKLTYAHSTDWGVLIPHLQLEWQHEFQDDPAKVEMRFLFDPTSTPFQIEGDPIDTDFFRFGIGMSFVMTKGRSGFFYYERLISRERFSQNSLALGIRLEF